MKSTAPLNEVLKIVNADHHDPFSVLGAHLCLLEGENAVAVRAFDPSAHQMRLIEDAKDSRCWDMQKINPKGFFEAVIPDRESIFPYFLERRYKGGRVHTERDPYSFLPVLSDYDLYLFNQGNLHRLYDWMGAHLTVCEAVQGVLFAVWAPNARRVSLVGDFNQWDGRRHPMRVRGASGVWELFIPGLAAGTVYKFEIKTKSQEILIKADPCAFCMELRPKTASRFSFPPYVLGIHSPPLRA